MCAGWSSGSTPRSMQTTPGCGDAQRDRVAGPRGGRVRYIRAIPVGRLPRQSVTGSLAKTSRIGSASRNDLLMVGNPPYTTR